MTVQQWNAVVDRIADEVGDDANDFFPAFDAWMLVNGYEYDGGLHCNCPDEGEHGHLPWCGYVKAS